MSCVAVFVDAGYLFAQGSTALSGSKKPRTAISLNETAVMAELTSASTAKCPGSSLLRVYWYDGTLGPKLSLEHTTLAHMDYIKLRLGSVSGHGQQKGVDSLIVTDLIELARNRAITDAVILSGDEDIRIGVQIAQSFGVRVHLIGIIPSRGSQSPHLLRESDTTTEWDKPTVSKFLSVKASVITTPTAPAVTSALPQPQLPGVTALDSVMAASLDAAVSSLISAMDSSEITAIKIFWKTQRGVPQEIDTKLLAQCRTQIGRYLSAEEKRYMRAKFSQTVQGMQP